MAIYISASGSTGAGFVANLKATLDSSASTFMIYTIPPYFPDHPQNTNPYTTHAMGYATIPAGSFVLSGSQLVYAPTGGLSVPITYGGRANWFLLEVPSGSKNLIFWPGTGVVLTNGQQYVITSLAIPLAE